MAGITTRKIPSGGSAFIYPARLAGVSGDPQGAGQGKITDAWGRQFHSPPSGIADFGAGTAPMVSGKITAQADTIVYFFNF